VGCYACAPSLACLCTYDLSITEFAVYDGIGMLQVASWCVGLRGRYAVDAAMLEMAQAVLDTIDKIAHEVKYTNVVIFENCHILKVSSVELVTRRACC
jgi:hypothetical protein